MILFHFPLFLQNKSVRRKHKPMSVCTCRTGSAHPASFTQKVVGRSLITPPGGHAGSRKNRPNFQKLETKFVLSCAQPQKINTENMLLPLCRVCTGTGIYITSLLWSVARADSRFYRAKAVGYAPAALYSWPSCT